MKVKGFSVVIIALLLCVILCFVGCKNTIEEEPTLGEFNEDVSNGVNSVCASVKNVTGLTGASAIYISLKGSSTTTDYLSSTYNYPIDFSLTARINISEENQKEDKLSVLSFTVTSETSSGATRSLMEIYYKEGILYVNYPPVFSRVAIKNFNLARVAAVLYNSKQGESGKLYEISNLIPSFLTDIFNNLTVNEEDDQTLYTFSVNYNTVYNALDNVLSNASIGIDVDELLSIFSLNSKSFEELAKGKGTVEVKTVTKRAEQLFKSLSYNYKNEGVIAKTVEINDFKLTAYEESMDLTAYPVVLAENLSSYTHYDFANISLSGDMNIRLSSTSGIASSIMGMDTTLDLSLVDYPCLFEVTTNNSSDGFEGLIRLYDIGNDNKEISAYYKNDILYLDLTDIVGKENTNNGYISLTKERSTDLLTSLGIVSEVKSPSALEITRGIGKFLSEIDKTDDRTDMIIDSELLSFVLEYLGNDPIIDWSKLNITINTESSSFKGLSASLSTTGITASISALDPSIGRENIVDKPNWVDSCVALDEIANVTPVIEGSISTNLAGIENTALVESLIYSLTGKEISILEDIYSFKLSANCSYSGAVSILRLDFLNREGRNACTFYYYNREEESKYLYVMQTINGIDVVEKLTLRTSSRYGEFAHFIHGNHPVEDSPANIGITNNSDSLTMKFNQEGLNGLLDKINIILPDFLVKEVPQELGLSYLSLTLGDSEIKAVFGGGKYIDLKISSFTIGYDSLAVKTIEVKPTNTKVSIYDDNNLPERLDITIGTDEGDKKLSVLAEDFGGWCCDNPPKIGDGVVEVDCYIKIFGQKVYTTVNVDCSNASDIKVIENAAYSQYISGEDNQFVFDRYQTEVDPFDIVNNRFNKLYIIANTTAIKPVIWYYGNGATRQILSEACFRNNDNPSYLITPAIVDFFGNEQLFTSKQFEIKLKGEKVTGIENADDFYTISAFTDDDPFNQSTYNNRNLKEGDSTLYLLTEKGNKVAFERLNWNIDSIKNLSIKDSDGKEYEDDALIIALREKLYSLDGKYSIDAIVTNCLGMPTKLTATVTVTSKIIKSITLKELTYGSLFIDSNDNSYTLGMIVIDPMQLRVLDSSVSLAKTVVGHFDNNQDVEISTVKWEIESVTLPLSTTTPINGTLAVVIGDETSGYQRFRFAYIARSYDLTEVGLGNLDGSTFTPINEAICRNLVEDGKYLTNISFKLEKLDPYSYIYPNAVRLIFTEFDYSYNGLNYALEAGSIVQKLDWNFENWNEGSIWQDEGKSYSDSYSIADMTIELTMSFKEKIVESWCFADENGNKIENYDKTEILSVVRANSLHSYIADDNGEYIFRNGLYVKANGGDKTTQRYSISEDSGKYSVYYKQPNNGENRAVILDPNAVDYLDEASYPSSALVRFKGDDDYTLVDIFWDLDYLRDNAENIRKNGYYGTLTVRLAYSQIMADVNIWIASSNPKNYFIDPAFEDYYNDNNKLDQRFVLKDSKNVIELSLIGVKEDENGKKQMVINDLFSESGLHDVICGCSEVGCKGRIYLYYDDNLVESGMFAVDEWIGLEQIKQLFDNAISSGKSIENVSGTVTLQAKVGDLILNVPVQVNSSQLLDLQLSGIPYVNNSIYSSLSGSAYAIDNQLFYDVDPYLSAVLEQSSYPTLLTFTYKGESVSAKIDFWDCSQFDGINLYEGGKKIVYACFDTPIGSKLSIPVTVNVKSRVIERVSVDGSTIKRIDVDCYSSTPFGENTAIESGRLIAYKSVSVKFTNDDRYYSLTMKYDVTDFAVSFRGGLIANNVEVYVGNDAGGYQAIGGYSIYASQKIVLKAFSEDVKAVKDIVIEREGKTLGEMLSESEKVACENILNGIIYSHDGFVATFTDFEVKEGDSEYVKLLKNKAWEALLIGSEGISFDVGYTTVDESNSFKYVYTTVKAKEYVDNSYGLCYRWTRGEEGIVKLELFNILQGLGGRLGEEQVISSGNKNYVVLTDDMFKYIRPTAKEYDQFYTVKNFIEDLQIKPIESSAKLFNLDAITISVFDKNDKELSLDQVLSVGTYKTIVAVSDEKFNGSISISFDITQKAIDDVVVRYGENTISRDTITLNAGTGLNIYAKAFLTTDTEVINIDVAVQYYDQEGSLLLPDESGFYSFSEVPGRYTIKFYAVDNNYRLTRGNISLIINEVK